MTLPRLVRLRIGRLFEPCRAKQYRKPRHTLPYLWHSGPILDSLLTAPHLRNIPGFYLPLRKGIRDAGRQASASNEVERFRSIAQESQGTTRITSNIEAEIERLARRGSLVQASRLYDALQSSGAPVSHSVQRALLDESLRHSDISIQEKVFSMMMGALREGKITWNDELLMGVLNFLSEASRPDLMEELLNHYSTSNKSKWKVPPEACALMIHAHCEGGQGAAALRWLQKYRSHAKAEAVHQNNIRPYLKVMRLFSESSPGDPKTCYSIFRQMIGDGIPPTVPAFTILMAMEVRRKSFRRVFALKRVMSRVGLQTDAVAFATLFKALEGGLGRKGGWKRTKKNSTQRPRHPPCSPRKLFLEMMISHISWTNGRSVDPSPFISASTLTVALRCFTIQRDYPAAMVVLQCFEACQLIPTLRSEWAVVAPILKRVQGTIGFVWKDPSARDPGYSRWVERMQGRLIDVRSAKSELYQVRKIFEDVRPKRGRSAIGVVSRPVLVSAEHQVENRLPPTDDDDIGALTWASRPKKGKGRVTDAPVDLHRSRTFLRQAIFADLSAVGVEGLAAERVVKDIIGNAAKEMLPLEM